MRHWYVHIRDAIKVTRVFSVTNDSLDASLIWLCGIVGAEGLARARQPATAGREDAPDAARADQGVWPAAAAAVRQLRLGGGGFGGRGRVVPPRRQLQLPPAKLRQRAHGV